jgi:hypothetical protein
MNIRWQTHPDVWPAIHTEYLSHHDLSSKINLLETPMGYSSAHQGSYKNPHIQKSNNLFKSLPFSHFEPWTLEQLHTKTLQYAKFRLPSNHNLVLRVWKKIERGALESGAQGIWPTGSGNRHGVKYRGPGHWPGSEGKTKNGLVCTASYNKCRIFNLWNSPCPRTVQADNLWISTHLFPTSANQEIKYKVSMLIWRLGFKKYTFASIKMLIKKSWALSQNLEIHQQLKAFVLVYTTSCVEDMYLQRHLRFAPRVCNLKLHELRPSRISFPFIGPVRAVHRLIGFAGQWAQYLFSSSLLSAGG